MIAVMDYMSGHTWETDTVGGVVVKSCLGQLVIWFLDLNSE